MFVCLSFKSKQSDGLTCFFAQDSWRECNFKMFHAQIGGGKLVRQKIMMHNNQLMSI